MGDAEDLVGKLRDALKEVRAVHDRVDTKLLYEHDTYQHAIFRHCQDSVEAAIEAADAYLDPKG